MKAYLEILKRVVAKGDAERDNRTGIPTVSIPSGTTFEHDMSRGFPLLTTKKMPMYTIATELEFFIKGITDKKWLKDRNVGIWNEWANPILIQQKYDEIASQWQGLDKYPATARALRNEIADNERDLGPIYGWQWRHWGSRYQFVPSRIDADPTDNYDPLEPGIDQVARAIKTLKENPYDRRNIVTAWNPTYIDSMALPPCHIMHQLTVENNRLNLIWTQRSCDMFLGIPFNIASYALLLMLYAKEAGLEPGILRGEFHDTHVYKNHLPQVREQLERKLYKLPTLEIPDENWRGMLNWSARDGFKLNNYMCHSAIRGDVAR